MPFGLWAGSTEVLPRRALHEYFPEHILPVREGDVANLGDGLASGISLSLSCGGDRAHGESTGVW